MAIQKSLSEVYKDDGLAKLPEIASKYGFYGSFISWKPAVGSRDEGIYFIMSPEPIDPNINIRDVTMLQTKSSAVCTKYWLEEISEECRDNNIATQKIVNETMQYAEKMATLRSIFDDYGPDVKVPDFIDPMQLGDLIRTFALSQYSTEPGVEIPLDVFHIRACAMQDLRKYCDRMRNVQEKWSKNPILRKLGIPNRDYLREQYSLDPHLQWSKNPLVRTFRWIKYHNSQQISEGALLDLSYGKNGIARYTMYSRYRDPKTGKMHKTGNYEVFVRMMKEKYPTILYHVKKEKTFRSLYARVKQGIPNPFAGKPCYEEHYDVMFCRRHSFCVYPLISYINQTDDYRTTRNLHPVSIEELKKSGERLVVKYIDVDNNIARNVGMKAEASGIPYSIDDGTEYSSDCEGIAFIFKEEDSWFPDWAISKTVSDYCDLPGEKKWPDSADRVRGPEVEKEPNIGFRFLREA